MYHISLPDGADYFSLQSLYSAHYTPVLPVLLLRGGRDISQGNFIKRGTLGKKWGTLKNSTTNVPRFLQKWGTLKNSLPNVPRFLSWGTLEISSRKW